MMSEYAFGRRRYAASAVVVLMGAIGVTGVAVQLSRFVKAGGMSDRTGPPATLIG
jgi:hypothetical protein